MYVSCPYCGEQILSVAKKCKHCGEWLDRPASHVPATPPPIAEPPVIPPLHTETRCPLKVVPAWNIPFFLLLTLSLYMVFWLYRVFKELHSRKAVNITPGKAVGYLFIPIFNYGWMFVMWPKLGRGITNAFSKAGLSAPATEVVWIAPVTTLACGVLTFALPSLLMIWLSLSLAFHSIVLCVLQTQMNLLAKVEAKAGDSYAKAVRSSHAQANNTISRTMHCAACGRTISDDAATCEYCGKSNVW